MKKRYLVLAVLFVVAGVFIFGDSSAQFNPFKKDQSSQGSNGVGTNAVGGKTVKSVPENERTIVSASNPNATLYGGDVVLKYKEKKDGECFFDVKYKKESGEWVEKVRHYGIGVKAPFEYMATTVAYLLCE